jgi:hypothetical protein
MLNTKQVREIMRKHGKVGGGVYTNKTTGDASDRRRVKCYFDGRCDAELVKELRRLAGRDNVTITEGVDHCYAGGPGIVVKCVLA